MNNSGPVFHPDKADSSLPSLAMTRSIPCLPPPGLDADLALCCPNSRLSPSSNPGKTKYSCSSSSSSSPSHYPDAIGNSPSSCLSSFWHLITYFLPTAPSSLFYCKLSLPLLSCAQPLLATRPAQSHSIHYSTTGGAFSTAEPSVRNKQSIIQRQRQRQPCCSPSPRAGTPHQTALGSRSRHKSQSYSWTPSRSTSTTPPATSKRKSCPSSTIAAPPQPPHANDMPAPLPASIPDTQLGLSPAELHLLRHHQSIALASAPAYSASTASSSAHQQHRYAGSSASSSYASAGRGRGSVRSSAASSRAGSAGAGQGRLCLDAGSLSVLGSHFERVMGRIQERVNFVSPGAARPILLYHGKRWSLACVKAGNRRCIHTYGRVAPSRGARSGVARWTWMGLKSCPISFCGPRKNCRLILFSSPFPIALCPNDPLHHVPIP